MVHGQKNIKTFHQGYKNQSAINVQNISRCLFWDPYKTLKAKRASCRTFEY